jgi:WhiB family transcriptional regulator, redox-sensing transcriptional regulator
VSCGLWCSTILNFTTFPADSSGVTGNYNSVLTETRETRAAWDETLVWSVCFDSKPEWMEKAACRGEPSSLFFPPSGVVSKRARSICSSCEVQVQCLAYAMATPDLVGTWGGTSQRARKSLRTLTRSQNGDTIG